MSGTVRVYVNGRGYDVPAGATALEAIRMADPAAARGVESGTRAIADSRGLRTDPGGPVFAGAIYRLVSGDDRGERAADAPRQAE